MSQSYSGFAKCAAFRHQAHKMASTSESCVLLQLTPWRRQSTPMQTFTGEASRAGCRPGLKSIRLPICEAFSLEESLRMQGSSRDPFSMLSVTRIAQSSAFRQDPGGFVVTCLARDGNLVLCVHLQAADGRRLSLCGSIHS